MNKMEPVEAAMQFINKQFPTCQGALLAGSVVRKEATETSDLDIIIFDQSLKSSYRESFLEFGWPIEAFVHSFTSYKYFFEDDCKRAMPSMPKMVAEGIILKDEERIIEAIKKEAMELLEKGPDVWSEETVMMKRYFITDALDDFKGCNKRAEELCIANTLAELVSEFVLRTNQKWIGKSKWLIRSLKNFDKKFANDFIDAFDCFYKTSDKQSIIQLVEQVLQPHGGELFEGFSMGKVKK
ncbi:nucleotidyltransferase [Heyndrickxia sporothermodurans]|nr:nucleotidyltransferase [Heyndrickxia sporothermodurans]